MVTKFMFSCKLFSSLVQFEALDPTALDLTFGLSFGDLRVPLLEVSAVVERQIFLVALQQQLEPLLALDARDVDGSVVASRQALRLNLFVERVAVGAVEDDSVAQLFAEERLEQRENHLEDLRLVHDVNAFDAEWNRVLQPVYDALGERRRKLPGLLERQAVHVKDHNRAVHLRFRLQHRRFQEQHAAFEHLIQRHFLMLPSLCERRKIIKLKINLHARFSLPNSSSRILLPRWSRLGKTVSTFALKMFSSFDGISA